MTATTVYDVTLSVTDPPDPSEVITALAVEVIVVAIAVMVAFLAVMWLLLRSADKPNPAMLTLSLSVITVLATIGFILTRENALVTVVAAGVGALAGGVTFQLGGGRKDVTGGKMDGSDDEGTPG